MKDLAHSSVLLACTVVLLGACHERSPMVITPDQPADDLEVTALQPSLETSLSRTAVDTTGVLNTEQSRYYAAVIVSGVKYDEGTTRQTVSYSSVAFSDKNQPVEYDGERLCFQGLDLGSVRINGMDMTRVQRFVHLFPFHMFGDRDTAVGPKYVLANRDGRDAKSFNYSGNSWFEWTVSGENPIDPFNLKIQTPDEITITNPKSTSFISTNEDLQIQWLGKAESFRLIISGLRGSDLQPALEINLKKSEGSVTIPSKVLALLPTDTFRTFVFSFISSKTAEMQVNHFSDEILVSASSIHDIVLTVL